jgi:hypothetical protein
VGDIADSTHANQQQNNNQCEAERLEHDSKLHLSILNSLQ